MIRRVGGLQIPSDTDTGESSEAVQLFIERARSHEPEFESGEEELAEIAQVTNRLDGIPLAIEMAAALVGTLSVGEILSRLDDRFRLLTGGGGRNLGRQQTLLATVDWSHDLLSEPERVLLRRLSVMSGSFSLEDVEAVCVGDGIDRTEVVTLLRRLVATSWVMRERGGDRAAYRLLETSRQYALDKLVSSSEAQRFRSKHSEWFADLAETGAESMLGGPDQTRWFDRIGSELDNFEPLWLGAWATGIPRSGSDSVPRFRDSGRSGDIGPKGWVGSKTRLPERPTRRTDFEDARWSRRRSSPSIAVGSSRRVRW